MALLIEPPHVTAIKAYATCTAFKECSGDRQSAIGEGWDTQCHIRRVREQRPAQNKSMFRFLLPSYLSATLGKRVYGAI